MWEKSLTEIYEDETEALGLASVSENPYKDLDDVNEIDLRRYQVKVKTKKEQIERGCSSAQEGFFLSLKVFSQIVAETSSLMTLLTWFSRHSSNLHVFSFYSTVYLAFIYNTHCKILILKRDNLIPILWRQS